VILWLVEPTTYIGAGEQRIAELLKKVNRKKHPVVLVINKTDTLKNPEEITDVIRAYREKCDYDDIVCVSAVTGKNEDELMETIFKFIPEGPLYYDEETVTEIPMRSIAEELIREQMLKNIKDEIPHGTAVVIEKFKERKDGIFDIQADIICERESHKGIIIGKGGAMLKKIGIASRMEIEEQLGAQVNLKLFVKVRKNWRDDENFIKSFGYDLRKYR
ncbi:MAG: GTPase Era, partial [Eubacteriales bacterium]|nr:GTPase Era [Eubacteriales bacterium]